MTDEQAAQLIEQNKKLLDDNATLRVELQQQKDIVAALLKRLYGSRSEQLSHDQLLMTFLEDEAKKPAAADPADQGPAAETQAKAPRAKRKNKLADSLKALPTRERIIVSPEVLADPEAYRLIGEEVSERLHVSPPPLPAKSSSARPTSAATTPTPSPSPRRSNPACCPAAF